MIIGTEGRDIRREHALQHVMGVTVGNDITARDVQKRHLQVRTYFNVPFLSFPYLVFLSMQWFKGKSLDGTCPLGPCIVPLDQLPRPVSDLELSLSVNGELRQRSRTSNMIFSIEDIIVQLSEGFTLKPVSD